LNRHLIDTLHPQHPNINLSLEESKQTGQSSVNFVFMTFSIYNGLNVLYQLQMSVFLLQISKCYTALGMSVSLLILYILNGSDLILEMYSSSVNLQEIGISLFRLNW